MIRDHIPLWIRWRITIVLGMWIAKICPDIAEKQKLMFGFVDLMNGYRRELGINPKPDPPEIAEIRRGLGL